MQNQLLTPDENDFEGGASGEDPVEVRDTEAGSGGNGQDPIDTGSQETDERPDEGEIEGEAGDTEGNAGEVADEPLVDIGGGNMVPVSEVQQALRDQARVKAREQELEARSSRVTEAELYARLLEQRPDLKQQLFAPQATRDFTKELGDHYAQMPDAYDRDGMAQWSLKRDTLIAEKSTADLEARARIQSVQSEAYAHNERIEGEAKKKYVESGSINAYEFENMAKWILDNVQLKGGKAPAEAFDVAFQVLHREKFEENIRLDAAGKALGPLGRNKGVVRGADSGLTSRTPAKTSEQMQDDEFIQRMNSRNGH